MNTLLLPTYDASEFLTSWNEEDVKGRGSFACVRKCEHSKLGRVAVKCFNITGSSHKCNEALKTIEREVDVLYRLNHKNIVQILGITRWANNVGIIMEYIDGINLEDLLMSKDIKDIPWLLRLRFFQEIAGALSHLHHYDQTKAFVHGDLKPQNILLTSDLKIKVADFGSVNIAAVSGKGSASIEFTPSTQYTPLYAAAELLKSPVMKREPSMDVYSMAMIGYEILTRKQVYEGSTNLNIVIQAIIDRGQQPDDTLLRDVESSLKDRPQDLEIFLFLKSIINECWNFDAKKRPDIRDVRNQTHKKLTSLAATTNSYHINGLISQDMTCDQPQTSKPQAKIKLEGFSFPFEKGSEPLFSHVPETITATATMEILQTQNNSQQFEIFQATNTNIQNEVMSTENNERKIIPLEVLIQQLEYFSNKSDWSKDDGQQLLSLWVQVHECKKINLTKQAAHHFPSKLDLKEIPLNENQLVAMSGVLKYTTKSIEKISLWNCQLRTSSFCHFTAALKECETNVGNLLISLNELESVEDIIPILHKVTDELDLRACFSDERGGSRYADENEKRAIQEALNSLENSSLKVGVDPSTTLQAQNCIREI